MVAKAWGGRFEGQTDPRVEKFTESISFDARLAAVDIQGSQAHARMLSQASLLTVADGAQEAVTAALGGAADATHSPKLLVLRLDNAATTCNRSCD